LFNSIRLSSQFDPEKLRELGPAFEGDGTVTAGNASQISDGAAVLILTSAAFAEKHDLRPLFRISGFGDAAQGPEKFPTTPSLTIPRAVKNAGQRLEDVDFFEINEAFSVSWKNPGAVELVTPFLVIKSVWHTSSSHVCHTGLIRRKGVVIKSVWHTWLEDAHFFEINEAFSASLYLSEEGAVQLLCPSLLSGSLWYMRLEDEHFSV
jgi:hypothetical protein